jgi:ABC-type cobalamin/Fe3+-siderophores transport system ATPase subunit/SAM-dependent methyltransferase
LSVIIETVDLPKNFDGEGLPEIKFYNLGDIIAVVGPNGVGKSRLFEILRKELLNQSAHVRLHNSILVPPLVAHIPPRLDLEQLQSAPDIVEIIALENFGWLLACSLSIINHLAHSAALERSDAVLPDGKDSRASEVWERVNKNVEVLLGARMAIDRMGRPTLYGEPLAVEKISEGQARLLQLALVLGIRAEKQPVIIFWDEPELHLHPGIVIKVLEEFQTLFNCQIWLASHSLSLAAYAGIERVWYMDSSGVDRGIRKSEEVRSGLYGKDDQGERVLALLSSPYRLAEATFAWQCLFEPSTVEFKSGDPQGVIAFSNILPSSERPLRVLDWGAGRGRLLHAAIEKWSARTANVIDYYAYDSSDKDQDACLRLISTVYGPNSKDRWFHDFAKARSKLSQAPADRVLMCNVLHEISPQDWRSVLNGVSDILSPDGYLLIMEDLRLPRGELAFKSGFLILDETAIRFLFGNCQGILTTIERERLASYLIPASCLKITEQSYRATLEYCLKSELDKIIDLRRRPNGSYKQGIDHMRSMMQFVTAYLSLNGLPSR